MLGEIAFALSASVEFETLRATNNIKKSQLPPPYHTHGPLVSVVIPAFEEEDYLPATLRSLENQTYWDIETIVVDNESTDATAAIAEEFGARILTNRKYNLSLSRNMGATYATGPILAFLDADTLLEPTAIERCVEKIREGKELVYTAKCSADSYIYSLLRIVYSTVIPRPYIGGAFLMVNKAAFEDVGGFSETCLPQEHCAEDRAFASAFKAQRGIGRIAYLRHVYASTSSRRLTHQNPFGPHWQERVVREKPERAGCMRR